MGKTVVFTDQTDFTARQIVEIYDTRNTIESDIRWLKDKLALRYFMWEDWIKISFQRYFLTMKT